MKKLIIATALFVTAGLCVGAGIVQSGAQETKVTPIATVETAHTNVMKDLGTAD